MAKYELMASSLQRLIEWSNRCDTATISASRFLDTSYYDLTKKDPKLFKKYQWFLTTDPKYLTKNQLLKKEEIIKRYRRKGAVNDHNHKKLERRLLALGYTLVELNGYYRESEMDKPSKEKSYFVINYLQWRADQGENVHVPNLFKDILETGRDFEQDSVCFALKGEDYALYNTSPYNGDPLGKKLATFHGKGGFADVAKEYAFSRIGSRPFGFKNFTMASAEYRGTHWVRQYNHYTKLYKVALAKTFVSSSNSTILLDNSLKY